MQILTIIAFFISVVHGTEVTVNRACDCDDSDGATISNLNITLNIAFDNDRRGAVVQSDSCGVNLPRSPNLLDEYSYEGEFPWYSAIYTGDLTYIVFRCSGTLISKSVVITSGACLVKYRDVKAVELLVFIGYYNFIQYGGHYQHRKIKEIVYHPEIKFSSVENDLALLILHRNIKITDYVRPICLWDISLDGGNLDGVELIHPGWGFSTTKYIDEKLSYIRMPVRPTDDCIFRRARLLNLHSSKNMFCVSFRPNSPTCKGDDGSGLYYKINGLWYIRGIDAISISWQGEVLCDDKHYAAVTDIAPYMPWIMQYI